MTDPQQQALFQLDPKFPESTNDPVNSFREIFNYERALRLHLEKKDGIPISLRLIRQLHRVLMEGVRGSDRDPGEFRRTQNQIGRPPRYVPPPVNQLPNLLDNLEKYLHAERPYDPLVDAFIVHYQFEAIHPFQDGNGRVGRLLLAILVAEWCNLSDQWLYMSAYFDDHKDEYIDRLLRISTHGAWEEWIAFCLDGVVTQAKDTQKRCERLLALHREFNDKVRATGGSVRLAAIVEDLFKSPVVVVARLAEHHKVSYPTARADLRKLARAGILRQLPNTPQISYFAPQILRATYDDQPE